MNKRNYSEKIKCSICGEVVEEYDPNNKQRIIKSWQVICCSCIRKMNKKNDEIEERISKLEKATGTYAIKEAREETFKE